MEATVCVQPGSSSVLEGLDNQVEPSKRIQAVARNVVLPEECLRAKWRRRDAPEEPQAPGDCREVPASRCVGVTRPVCGCGGPLDWRDAVHPLPVAPRLWRTPWRLASIAGAARLLAYGGYVILTWRGRLSWKSRHGLHCTSWCQCPARSPMPSARSCFLMTSWVTDYCCPRCSARPRVSNLRQSIMAPARQA